MQSKPFWEEAYRDSGASAFGKGPTADIGEFHANFKPNSIVLDAGCGEGYGAALLASKADAVTGVDIDPQSVENAKRTYCDPKLKFLVGRCEQIPLPDASVDVVTSFETIEHHCVIGHITRAVEIAGPVGKVVIHTYIVDSLVLELSYAIVE